jgi:Fe-S cluster biogenesis protein NfuA
MTDNQELRKQIGRIDGLVQEIEAIADPSLRATTKELVQCLMDLHGAGLERILEIVSNAGEAGERIVQSLGTDDLVSSLLVLYDLHPDDFATRAHRGLDKARQRLAKRGGSVDVLSIGEGIVHVRIDAGGHGHGHAANDMKSIVSQALFETVPDAADIVIEGAEAQPGFVPLASLQMPNGKAGSAPALNQS